MEVQQQEVMTLGASKAGRKAAEPVSVHHMQLVAVF